MAHHLLTFSGVAKLPPKTRQATVASSWKLDLPENRMALPANVAAWIAPPNSGLYLPYHSSNHPLYNPGWTLRWPVSLRYQPRVRPCARAC